MKTVRIKEPVWAIRAVGIGEYHFNRVDKLKVKITYKTTTGEQLYPGSFLLTKENAFKYPRQILNNGVVLRIIPIKDLQVFQPLDLKQGSSTFGSSVIQDNQLQRAYPCSADPKDTDVRDYKRNLF